MAESLNLLIKTNENQATSCLTNCNCAFNDLLKLKKKIEAFYIYQQITFLIEKNGKPRIFSTFKQSGNSPAFFRKPGIFYICFHVVNKYDLTFRKELCLELRSVLTTIFFKISKSSLYLRSTNFKKIFKLKNNNNECSFHTIYFKFKVCVVLDYYIFQIEK